MKSIAKFYCVFYRGDNSTYVFDDKELALAAAKTLCECCTTRWIYTAISLENFKNEVERTKYSLLYAAFLRMYNKDSSTYTVDECELKSVYVTNSYGSGRKHILLTVLTTQNQYISKKEIPIETFYQAEDIKKEINKYEWLKKERDYQEPIPFLYEF